MNIAGASHVLAAAWIPFTVVLVLLLIFSCLYIRYYQNRHECEKSSTVAAVMGLFVSLLTAAVVPVDIFLVSFMKNADGSFKPWANDSETRAALQNGVLYTYYSLYGCIVFFIFAVMPLVYFYHEEKDDDADIPCRIRFCGAIKYAIAFVIVACILFTVGAFIPWQIPPFDQNSTEWERLQQPKQKMH